MLAEGRRMHVVPIHVGGGLARRRSARIVPTAHLTVTIPTLAVPLELRNLSFGGFAISAPRPFKTGLTHRFTFAADNGLEVTLVAKAVHCYASLVNDQQVFVTGWEFMLGSADVTDAGIRQLIDAARV
jgi:hypothetical protein